MPAHTSRGEVLLTPTKHLTLLTTNNMIFIGTTKEYLCLTTNDSESCNSLNESVEDCLTVLWFTQSNQNKLIIDGDEYVFSKNEIVFLTEFHKTSLDKLENVKLLRFNRPFYCIIDNDKEVGCKGVLFFGASQVPIITIPEEDLDKFEMLWKMFTLEMQSQDNMQKDMLQMMLKRYLILCTRIYKSKMLYLAEDGDSDIVREFNFLVETHFKSIHSVTEYAKLLHKSPKTISNIFRKLNSKSPLQFIHERKMLEAKRLLIYTTKRIKEIAYEVGFEDIQTFSRFFKRNEGISPSEYKETRQLSKIANY
jgi:AraC-like DNA-binding protein